MTSASKTDPAGDAVDSTMVTDPVPTNGRPRHGGSGGSRAVVALGLVLVLAAGLALWFVTRPSGPTVPSAPTGTAFEDLDPVGLPMLRMYTGKYAMIPTQRLVNTTADPVTLQRIELVDVPEGWDRGPTRAWTYASTEGLPAAVPEDPADPFNPVHFPSYPVAGIVCPPSKLCPYYALNKVTSRVAGNFEFLTSRVTYTWRGKTYQQVLRYPVAVAVVAPGTDLSTVYPTPTTG